MDDHAQHRAGLVGALATDPPVPGAPTLWRRPLLPLWVIAAIAAIAALRVAADLLVPVALALYLATLLGPLVEWLRRRRVPRALSALLLLAVLIATVAGLAEATWQPAMHWLDRAPQSLQSIRRKIDPLRAVFARVDRATSHVEKLAEGAPAAAVAPAGPSASTRALLAAPGVVATAGSVIAFTAFLLIGGPPLLHRLSAARTGGVRRAHAIRAVQSASAAIGRYFATVALINAGLGAATAVLTHLVGLPNPLLWGCVAAALNFVPYLGSAATITLLTAAALVSGDTTGPAVAVFCGYLGLATLEGQVVQPLLVGRRMELSPLLVFSAVWFGGWLWGVAGVLLAGPALVAYTAARPRLALRGSTDDPAPAPRPRWRLRPAEP